MLPLSDMELRRCIENLLSNAVRFAARLVRVTVQAEGRQAALIVDDDGPGLPDTRAFVEVWKRDVRYHEDIGLSGSGLGLSIVKEVVERAGGHVEAEPAVTGGARFMFALPLCEASQAG